MPKPTPDWIRRHTTVADLLDDGVENFSDIPSLMTAPRADEDPDAASQAARDATREAVRTERARRESHHRRRAVSGFGLGLGVMLAFSGALLVLFPVDASVYHARGRRPSFIEHVTVARSRLYGTALLLGGLAVIAYAAKRPRHGRP